MNNPRHLRPENGKIESAENLLICLKFRLQYINSRKNTKKINGNEFEIKKIIVDL